ncbi:kinase-like domain-containing protein [Mycena rosella]|uniref:non-specific serine/threonine protein kinase n=1 Tax=Mycena rosella TaxID=1033263 RepID=A0AAD7CU09_MYCRO|nr:kinase-like domain-containing protein [Mycena rosella]
MGTASDAVLTLAKGQCDEDLQKVITHVTSFLANVQSMNRQFGGHSPETGVGETALKESSPQDPSSQSRRGLDPESRDTHTLVLCDILRVSTEMINTPVERFLAQPTSCVYFAKKVRAIGNTWEISPLWPGQNWYFQSLLAVSRFSRTVKWYQADQRTAHLLGNDTDESWSFFLSKPPRWYQKGPKGKILAPWKASLMDYGLLPPDLPVLQEEEPDYLVLRDLQLKSADPLSHSFRNPVVDDASAPESIKDFDIIKSIHKGESKAVFLAKRRPTGENFVVKVLEKGEMFAKNKITIIHAKRTAVLHQTDSHFVNKIHFAFQSKTKVYLVKELLSQGDCGALIRSLGHIEEDTARDYVCQIVHGLEHLHNQGITHRDLRPENILIDHAHRLSLTDFGVSQKTLLSHHIGPGSRQMDDSSMLKHRLTGTQFLRSVYYITPETILGLQDDDASIDWWAFGIITYEFMYGGTPFEDDNEDLELVFQKILSGKIDWNRDPIFIFAPSIAPSIAARDFIRSLLNPDPASRCSFRGADGVKAHRFFDDIRPNIRTAANVSSQSSSRSASQNLRQHLPDTSNSVPSGPSASPPSPKPSERSLGNASAGQAEGSRKRPSSLTLNQRRTSQESSTDPSPTRRRRSSSGRSTPYSAGKYWPGLRRRTSSRNSSDGRGSGWLSGYTTTDSDPETDESSISSRFPSAYSSQREYNVPGYNLPSHQILLNDLVSKIGKYPFESGAVADIYRGTLKSSTSPVPVAVKIFRRMHAERETLERTSRYLYQEARIWRQLDHPNILPFLGISLDLGLSPALISPYCAAGPIMKYLHNNDQTKRLQMVIGVANGLNYLHSEGIVHGNLCTV